MKIPNPSKKLTSVNIFIFKTMHTTVTAASAGIHAE